MSPTDPKTGNRRRLEPRRKGAPARRARGNWHNPIRVQLRSGITLLVVPEKKTGELTEADAKELSELLTDVLMPLEELLEKREKQRRARARETGETSREADRLREDPAILKTG